MIMDENICVRNEVHCPKCGNKYGNAELGIYICPKCGNEEKSEFGVVRTYLEKNEGATVSEISKATEVSIAKINEYLENGRIQIKDTSAYFLKCQKCKTEIKYGRFCKSCAASLCNELSSALTEGMVGEKPHTKSDAKMRFFGR